ncbi:poly-beta-1,6 N-acetyl-D-glucosamine export porin PgaA [Dyella sp.]|uniref:poly-beta-1,6 N-acetyl-D-glucosamine export porin PgaA n=1 Tax=Dyella sp. TaxID=1869338 RepID=UPI002ED5265C
MDKAPHRWRARMALAIVMTLYGINVACAAGPTNEPEDLLARARAEREAGHRVQALAICQDVLARWPDDPDAHELNVRLLQDLGASARAYELTSQLPRPLQPADRAVLHADAISRQIRWAAGEPADLRQPYAEADAAVDAARSLADDPVASDRTRLRARFDLLVALDQAGRPDETLAVYAPMKQAGQALPAYAERAVADAQQKKHDPRDAAALYEDSIRQDPGPYDDSETDPRVGLMYAYLDMGQSRKAINIIDRLAADEAPWRYAPGSRVGVQNPRKVDADTAAADVRDYVGLYQDAYQRLSAMSAQAPANAGIRRELGMSELARGWPRQAEQTLNIASTLDERDIGAYVGQAEVHSALYEYDQVPADLAEAKAQAPRSSRVINAEDAWDRERGWQLDITHDQGKGSSPDYGDRDQETQATLASPLLDDHWRVLALARSDSAALPEGDVRRDRLGLGVRGYLRGLEFYVQALPSVDKYVGKTAIEAGANWAISDQWSVAADWSSAGDDVPLRGQYYGITGKTLNTSLQWRRNELQSAKLTLYRDRFTDGNLRKGWDATFLQRLHTAPNVTFDGGVDIGGSRNSQTERPYFNPPSDRSYALTGRVENLLSQYYARTWTQRIDVSVGRYNERGYASDWMFSARYGQYFQPQLGLRFGWGIAWHNQPYDGRRESRVVLDLLMHWGE